MSKETTMTKHYPKGLDDRMRDGDGEIRKKRDDTLVRTLRKEYGPSFCRRLPLGYQAPNGTHRKKN